MSLISPFSGIFVLFPLQTQPIKAIATFKYNVTGERRNVFIESCTSTARYVLSPTLDIEDGSFMVVQK